MNQYRLPVCGEYEAGYRVCAVFYCSRYNHHDISPEYVCWGAVDFAMSVDWISDVLLLIYRMPDS